MTNMYLIIMVLFATIVLAIYAITPKKYRYIVLLLASVAAIFVCSHFMGFFIILTSLTVYLCAFAMFKIDQKYAPILQELPKPERKAKKKIIQRNKYAIMAAAIVINITILLILKYLNFFGNSISSIITHFGGVSKFSPLKILLPLGISYYTLQALSYVIDVAQGKIEPEVNPLKVTLFICFSPQLLEGPIGRFGEMREELTCGAQVVGANVVDGYLKCFWGIFKVLIVSNRLAMIAGEVFKNYTQYSGFTIVLGAIAFTMQLYAEFSGYIDIASGVSKMFGINLKKNFDLPFLAENVADFWRRWHISLGSWFRDYLFYPIAASNLALNIQSKDTRASRFAGKAMTIFTLLIIWFLTGLWHGASSLYVLYGLYYFALMSIYEIFHPLFDKLWRALKIEHSIGLRILAIIKTFVLVNIGMLLFRASSPTAFFSMFGSIFKVGGDGFKLFSFIEISDFVVLIIGLVTIIISGILTAKKINVREEIIKLPYLAKFAIFMLIAIIIIIFGAYGNGYLPPDPIYGGF